MIGVGCSGACQNYSTNLNPSIPTDYNEQRSRRCRKHSPQHWVRPQGQGPCERGHDYGFLWARNIDSSPKRTPCPTALSVQHRCLTRRLLQITRPGRGGAGNYNEPMSPDRKEQEIQAFQQESMLIKERQDQTVPIGGKARHNPRPSYSTDQFNCHRPLGVGVWATLQERQPVTSGSLNTALRSTLPMEFH